MVVGAILVVITMAFGAVAYDAPIPSGMAAVQFLLTFLVGSLSFAALALALTPAVPNADAAPPIVNAIDPAAAVPVGHLHPARRRGAGRGCARSRTRSR